MQTPDVQLINILNFKFYTFLIIYKILTKYQLFFFNMKPVLCDYCKRERVKQNDTNWNRHIESCQKKNTNVQ